MTMSPTGDVPGGARALARRAMTAQIAALATGLFVERGYDETTIDDVCAAAEISRTTFFRYFRSKEDVLLRDFEDLGSLILAQLVERPGNERVWTALSHAIEAIAEPYGENEAQTRAALALMIETPSLGAFHRDKLGRWVRQLHPEVARRLGVDVHDAENPSAPALIAAAFACMDAALVAWVASDGREDLADLMRRALRAVA